jgi:hypothetical protein
MMTLAVLLFVLAAVGGVTMAVMHFRGQTPPPKPLAMLHGAAAVLGILVLFLVLWPAFVGGPAVALVMFALAAIGGVALVLGFHRRNKPLPSPLVLGHGALAVLALLILLSTAFAKTY